MKNKFLLTLQYISLLRPYQWVKNLLVFSGLIFSTSLFEINAIYLSLAAFAIFCLASSGIYILNDLRDIKHDKFHPTKKHRPIASGKVAKIHAITIMSILIPTAIIFSYFLDTNFFFVIIIYLGINTAYSFGLKKVVILDAMIIAMGFLLRAFAGCAVIHVKVTPWLFICTLSLALTLSFGKRRNELNILKADAKNHRETLQFYNTQLLDIILTICSTATILTYSLYTVATETVLRFGTQRLIVTMVFVLYGIFRYLYLIYTKNTGGDPTKLLMKDFPSVINGILWILCIVYIIYGKRYFQL